MAVEMTKSPRKNVPDVGIKLGGRLHAKRTRFRSSYRARSLYAWWRNTQQTFLRKSSVKIPAMRQQ